MAAAVHEHETHTHEQDQEESFDYPVEVEDAGPATKKVKITVPRDRIATYTERTMGGIRADAALPGFRKGKAPRHLIERRSGKVLKDQVQQDLIRESYQQAMQRNNLTPLGDPEFDDPDSVKLPDEGDLVYSFTVEVQPDFSLPTLEGLTIRKPKIHIKDEHVQQALQNLREQQGSLMPVEDRGVEEKDYLIGDVHVRQGETEIAHQRDAQLIARPGRIAGIEIADFAARVKGMKPGEERSFAATAPAGHPDQRIAGQEVSIALKLKDVKALQLAEIDGPFLESLGFSNEQELLDALREQMVERVDADVQANMRRQVQDYLLNNTQIDLPKKLSERQAGRVINRRAVNLLMRGMPRQQVEANLERLSQGADEEAVRELKLFFILTRIADDRQVDVADEELNGQVAMMAINQGQRPESLRDRMEKDGTLANLYIQLREQKALDVLIEGAKVEEFEPSAEEQKQTVEAAATGEAGGDEAEDVT